MNDIIDLRQALSNYCQSDPQGFTEELMSLLNRIDKDTRGEFIGTMVSDLVDRLRNQEKELKAGLSNLESIIEEVEKLRSE